MTLLAGLVALAVIAGLAWIGLTVAAPATGGLLAGIAFVAFAVLLSAVVLLRPARRPGSDEDAEEHMRPLRRGGERTEARLHATMTARGLMPSALSQVRHLLESAADAARPASVKLPAWRRIGRHVRAGSITNLIPEAERNAARMEAARALVAAQGRHAKNGPLTRTALDGIQAPAAAPVMLPAPPLPEKILMRDEPPAPAPDDPETCLQRQDGTHTWHWYNGGQCAACDEQGPESRPAPAPEIPADTFGYVPVIPDWETEDTGIMRALNGEPADRELAETDGAA